MKENHKGYQINNDKHLRKIQTNFLEVMGHLQDCRPLYVGHSEKSYTHTVGVCHKQGKVSVPTGTEGRFFGISGKFNLNDFSPPKEQNRKVTGAVRGTDK